MPSADEQQLVRGGHHRLQGVGVCTERAVDVVHKFTPLTVDVVHKFAPPTTTCQLQLRKAVTTLDLAKSLLRLLEFIAVGIPEAFLSHSCSLNLTR